MNRDVIPLDDATPDVIPLDDQPDVIPLDEPKPTLSKVEDAIKNGWSAFEGGVQFVGRKVNQAAESPAGRAFLGPQYNDPAKMWSELSDTTAETLGEKFPKHPIAAAAAGFAVGSIPDVALAFVGGGEEIGNAAKNLVPEAGLTSVGEKIAQNVAKTESVAPIADSVIKLPTGEVKVLDTSKLPQPLVAKLEQSKQVAANLEGRLTKATNALEDFTKNGTDGLSISAREQEWTNRLADMKAEHADLRKQIQTNLFDHDLQPKSKAYVDNLVELQTKKSSLVSEYDSLTPVGPKEQKILDQIAEKRVSLQNELRDASTANYADQAIDRLSSSKLTEDNSTPAQAKLDKVQSKTNVLDLIEQKAHQQFQEKFQTRKQALAQSINKAEADISELGRTYGDSREKGLIALRDKTNSLEANIAEMEAKYRLHRMEKFNRQKDKLTEIAAYAENDLRNLGFTSKEIHDGFVKFVRGEPTGVDALKARLKNVNLDETTKSELIKSIEGQKTPGTSYSKMERAAEHGNVISKDLYDGLVAAPDLTGFNADFGQLSTNFDELDRLTKGAWSREFKQDFYNKKIQSYEVSNHFLQKINKLLEEYGLTDADQHTFRQYREGKIQAPVGREKAFELVDKEFGAIMDESLDLRNARHAQRGEPLIPRREDYVTSALDHSMKDDLYVPAKEAMKLQYAKKKNAEFGFDQQRQDLIPEEMRMGAFDVIKMYTVKTAKEVSLSDSVEKLRALAEVAQKSQKPNMANYFNSMADRITGEAFTNAVKNAGISAERSKVVHKAMELGGNWAANKINTVNAGIGQINSVMLASKDIGIGRAILSVPDGFLTELKEQIMKATVNPAYESFATEHSKVLRLAQVKETAQALQVSKKFGPIAAVDSWVYRFHNDFLYKGVFNQAYKAARSTVVNGEPLSHSVAVKVADAVVEKSQGLFEDATKPAVISSGQNPWINLAAPIQTSVLNTFNVLKNDYVFSKLSATEKAAAAGRYLATGAVVNTMVALATGKSLGAVDFIPFFRLAQMGVGGIFRPAVLAASGLRHLVRGEYSAAASDTGNAAGEAALMTETARKLGGQQAINTAKGAAQLIKGDTIDPRVLIFGPKPKEKSGD